MEGPAVLVSSIKEEFSKSEVAAVVENEEQLENSDSFK